MVWNMKIFGMTETVMIMTTSSNGKRNGKTKAFSITQLNTKNCSKCHNQNRLRMTSLGTPLKPSPSDQASKHVQSSTASPGAL